MNGRKGMEWRIRMEEEEDENGVERVKSEQLEARGVEEGQRRARGKENPSRPKPPHRCCPNNIADWTLHDKILLMQVRPFLNH